MTLLEQIQAQATSSSSSSRIFNWLASKEAANSVECTIKGHRFLVVVKADKRALAAMIVANKLVISHETTDSRTAKEWAWRQAHKLGLIAAVKSVKVVAKK